MSDKNSSKEMCCGGMCKCNRHRGGGGEAVYGLGFIGALIYFIQNADGFWTGVLGVLQAIIWPVLVVYKLLESFFK